MKAVLQILRGAFQDVWEDLWTMLVCNLLWYISNLLIVPGPPATLALNYYANRLAHGEVADLGDYWMAFRRYWGPAWRWGGVNLGMIAFMLGDFLFDGFVCSGRLGLLYAGLLPGATDRLVCLAVLCPSILVRARNDERASSAAKWCCLDRKKSRLRNCPYRITCNSYDHRNVGIHAQLCIRGRYHCLRSQSRRFEPPGDRKCVISISRGLGCFGGLIAALQKGASCAVKSPSIQSNPSP